VSDVPVSAIAVVAVGLGFAAYAHAVVLRHPDGREVTVFYDPTNPNNAVLERGAGSGSAFLLVFAVVGLLVATGAFVSERR